MTTSFSILTDEFALAAAEAGRKAREQALAAGHYVVYMDDEGRFVKEEPDGRRFEVVFHPDQPRETHMEIVRELPAAPAR